jgi:DNA-binding NarL/FixJ family response regulator
MRLSALQKLLEMLLEEHGVNVLEVRRALTRFDSTAEMAKHLGKSVHTIEKHIENMERKLKAHSRARMVYRAIVLGYLR